MTSVEEYFIYIHLNPPLILSRTRTIFFVDIFNKKNIYKVFVLKFEIYFNRIEIYILYNQ